MPLPAAHRSLAVDVTARAVGTTTAAAPAAGDGNNHSPSTAFQHYDTAVELHHRNHCDDARSHYRVALLLDPTFADAHNNLGVLYHHHDRDFALAQHHYQRAVTINPDHVDAHNNLGVLMYHHCHDHDAATEHFHAALRACPEDPCAHYNLGALAHEQGEFYEARHQYEAALRANPAYVDAHNNLGVLLHTRFSDYTGAIRHFEATLAIDATDSCAHYNLAATLHYHGTTPAQRDLARSHYEAALAVNEHDACAHYHLALLLRDHIGDREAAKPHFDAALLRGASEDDVEETCGVGGALVGLMHGSTTLLGSPHRSVASTSSPGQSTVPGSPGSPDSPDRRRWSRHNNEGENYTNAPVVLEN